MGNAWQSLPERERGVEDGGTVDSACEKVTCDEIGIPRTQINEMKSAEMPKSYRRVPANGTLRIEWMSNHMYLRHRRAAQLEGGEGSGRTGLFGTRGTRRKSC